MHIIEKMGVGLEKLTKYTNNMIAIYVFVVLYKLFFDFIYVSVIAIYWESVFHVKLDLLNYVAGWILVLLLPLLLKRWYKENTNSSIFVMIINLFYFLPLMTFCGLGKVDRFFFLTTVIFAIFLNLFNMFIPYYSLEIRSKYRDIIFKIITAVTVVVVTFIFVFYSKGNILIGFSDVYEIRRAAEAYSMPMWLNYLNSVAEKIIPVLLLYGLFYKKKLLVLITVALQIMAFSFAGSKSILLFYVIVLLGYIFYRKIYISYILPALLCGGIVGIAETYLLGSVLIISLIFRRTMILCGKISYDFYTFFQVNPTNIYREGFMGRLGFSSVYDQSVARVIGENFYNQWNNANNGLIGDSWCNLGIFGILILPFILVLCFRIFDFVSTGIDKRLTIGIVAYFAIAFINTAWSTVLLTHGYLVICLILMLFPKESYEKELI